MRRFAIGLSFEVAASIVVAGPVPARAARPPGSDDARATARSESEAFIQTTGKESTGFFMSTPDPLSSWNEGDPKHAILAFVDAVTDEAGLDHGPPAERLEGVDNAAHP